MPVVCFLFFVVVALVAVGHAILPSLPNQVPAARSYFEIEATSVKFTFPDPSFIEGIKSKGKALMKMKDVEFTYPVNDTPTLFNITVQVSMASRVACVGRNGAGKCIQSTMEVLRAMWLLCIFV